MGGFMTSLGVIIFIFGILQVILFFKLWQMTNDVRKIKSSFNRENAAEGLIRREILKGEKTSELKDLLFNSLYSELESAKGVAIYNEKDDVPGILGKYRIYYQKAGIEFPKVFDGIESYESLSFLMNNVFQKEEA